MGAGRPRLAAAPWGVGLLLAGHCGWFLMLMLCAVHGGTPQGAAAEHAHAVRMGLTREEH